MESPEVNLDGVAIVGMAGRFPGAEVIGQFWANLCAGVESVVFFSDDELEITESERQQIRNDADYVRCGAILEDADMFDAAFFRMTAPEAEITDPQHRVFLECAWQALENAGYDPHRFAGPIGVYAGTSRNSYVVAQLQSLEKSGALTAALFGNEKDYLSTRVSYKLNLRGPSINVQTACSTSLVAVCQAYHALLTYQCDMALAGGVSISYPQKTGYHYEEGAIHSPDGHTRTFDVHARGTIHGEGAGVVVLKRLEDAYLEGDYIYAVLKGAAVNNDGANKVSFTAPSVDGQAEVIAAAQAIAGFPADSISYIEAHGTATPLGDPIEVAALTKVFRSQTDRKNFCAIGSVKTNIGHLDAAAGVAGLIKTALSLERKQLPPSLNFSEPNPKLELETSPFYVNTKLQEWPANGLPRRAGVSCFGVGGTNAHVVLEEAPATQNSAPLRPYELLVLSARSPEALDQASANLAAHLKEHPDANIADVAFTLQVGRHMFEHRRAAVCCDTRDAAALVSSRDSKRVCTSVRRGEDIPVVFLFPGQGSQYVNMGADLYRTEPVFRRELDTCADILLPLLGLDLRTLLYPEPDAAGTAHQQLGQTRITQPALFALEYALAKVLMSWGIHPRSMIGHSAGEYVAACIAEVFTLEDALGLIADRGRLMQELRPGAMLAVRLPERELAPLLDAQTSIAAVNAPSMCVVSGPFESITALQTRLGERSIHNQPVPASHAFHSVMMEPALDPFLRRMSETTLQTPTIPFISNITGNFITAEEATSPEYWARHLRNTVRFADGISTLLKQSGNPLFLEVGPGQSLSSLVRQCASSTAGQVEVVSAMRHRDAPDSDEAVLLQALGRMWVAGMNIDWHALHAPRQCRRVPLPSYPFEKKRYSIRTHATDSGTTTLAVSSSQAAGQPKEANMTQPDRTGEIRSELNRVFTKLTGVSDAHPDPSVTFLELGFDSLFLAQTARVLQDQFGVKITFRQLLTELTSIDQLVAYLDTNLPPERFRPPSAATVPAPVVPAACASPARPLPSASLQSVVEQQLEIMRQQLALLSGTATASAAPADAATSAPVVAPVPRAIQTEAVQHGPFRPVNKAAGAGLSPRQQEHLENLIGRYIARTKRSKEMALAFRTHLADPRAVAGFRRQWKEMVYPIVAERSEGSRIWDIDGNEYVDFIMGFGAEFFGHRPPFLNEAVRRQLDTGTELGPQTALAGEVAELICELTGMERVTFCNTGSEAVMTAMRLARTATGRDKVVVFSGAYHGNFDPVLVRASKDDDGVAGAGPIAPGIPGSVLRDTVVLTYGETESLETIRLRAGELAAVLVDPAQTRTLDPTAVGFLHELRSVTEQQGIALIFDEVVTGFRVHPGGAQALYGIRADLATYGKVVGGGMPIGVVAGKATIMDALDGGCWQYGDDSFPETAVTVFAGTFVRHPLAMAAARAVLRYLKEQGPQLQHGVNEKARRTATTLNDWLESENAPIRIRQYSSVMYVDVPADLRYGGLLFYHLREKGIHLWEGRNCIVTTAHTDADMETLVRAFQESVRELQAGDFLPAPARKPEPRERSVASTEGQKEIWLATQMGADASRSYNLIYPIYLRGDFQYQAMRGSLQQLTARHESLRTTFSADGTTQTFHARMNIETPLYDLSTLDASGRDDRVKDFLQAETAHQFDLVKGPLFRSSVLKLESNLHLLVLTTHHIISDGWSGGVLLYDLSLLYNRECGHDAKALPVPHNYGDYAEWLHNRHEEAAKDEAYWLDTLAAPPPPLQLPSDLIRPRVRTYNGNRLVTHFDAHLALALKKFSAQQGSTLFACMLAAFQALLHRIAAQADIVTGIPAAGQTLVENQYLTGHCVHLLPLRSRMEDNDTFATFLRRTQETVAAGFEHFHCTFGQLVSKLRLARDGRPPLVSVLFNLDRMGALPSFVNLEMSAHASGKRFAAFDLSLNVIEKPDGFALEFDYNTDVFDEATVIRWMNSYGVLLRQVIASPHTAAGSIDLLDEQSRQAMFCDMRGTEIPVPDGVSVYDLIGQQAEKSPHATAVRFHTEQWTYGELNDRATRIASALSRIGAGRGARVGVCIQRSPAMVAALLGVLKSGAAYIPIDPAYPTERIALMLEDGQPLVVLISEATETAIPAGSVAVLRVETAMRTNSQCTPVRVEPRDAAYIMYTSGSTGKPKGVVVTHGNVVNFFSAMDGIIGPDPGVWMAVTSISFDISVFELFWTLARGFVVVLQDEGQFTSLSGTPGDSLPVQLARHKVTHLQCTPTLAAMLTRDAESLASLWPLRRMMVGGEVLPPDLGRHLAAAVSGELWNLYGPTETTVWSTASRIRKDDPKILIGRAVANTRLYVLDAHLQPVLPGCAGELFIGGAGVAEGYWNRPDLTAERFLNDPFAEAGGRMYKTGDVVRYTNSGDLEFLGRIDQQVKIRGYRVELGEIEEALKLHPSVLDAVVVARDDGAAGKRLVSYVIPKEPGTTNEAVLRQWIRNRLPAPLVPSAWVLLEAFPRTPNGKIDRKSFPEPAGSDRADTGVAYEAPRTPTEHQVAAIWREILNVRQIGIHDNFFDAGGHSLLATQIAARIQVRLEVPFKLIDMFESPTVAGLAERIEALTWAKEGQRALAVAASGDHEEFEL